MADRLHHGAGRGAKWRYTLPETENIPTARSASPLVFLSSTPKHDDDMSQIKHPDWTKIITHNLAGRSEKYQVIQIRFDAEKGQREEKDKVGMIFFEIVFVE